MQHEGNRTVTYIFIQRQIVDAGCVRRTRVPVQKAHRRIVDHPEVWSRTVKDELHAALRQQDRLIKHDKGSYLLLREPSYVPDVMAAVRASDPWHWD